MSFSLKSFSFNYIRHISVRNLDHYFPLYFAYELEILTSLPVLYGLLPHSHHQKQEKGILRPILETEMCTGEMLFVRDIRTFHLHSSSRNKHKQSKVRILEIYSNKKEKRGHDLTTNQLATSHVIPNKKTKKILLALKHSCSLERSFDNDKKRNSSQLLS